MLVEGVLHLFKYIYFDFLVSFFSFVITLLKLVRAMRR